MTKYNVRSARTLTDQVLELDYFQGPRPAIPYIWRVGRNPLVMVVGENAGGKSFLRRITQAACQHSKIECIHISLEGRCREGFARAFLYGTEMWEATGANSAETILGGIRTCQKREKPHVMFWDEPDLGLSEAWAAGAGRVIRDFVQNKPKHTRAIYLVTHSRALARELAPVRPHYLFLGSTKGPRTFKEWLDHQPAPRDLSKLAETSRRRFTKIQKILDRKRT
jgi:hypothetical protein